MPTRRAVLSCALITLAACGSAGVSTLADAAAAPRGTLAAYQGEAEFVEALTRWRDASRRRQVERRAESAAATGTAQSMAPGSPPPPAPAAAAKLAADSAAPAQESITNVQTAGVDEGGIVKRAGEHLVILRRGRLFTVRIGADTLQPAGMSDAYAPGTSPAGAWYDELLVSGNTVVVIGYSYARGGTEIGLFDLGHDGRLDHRATYHLKSFDYFSSRNYASRLIGRKLVFYTPSYLNPHAPRPWEQMPGLRRWWGEATPAEFQRILPATRIYRTDDDFEPGEPLALHTVTACDLGAPELQCESTAVLGPAGRVFYVSQGSVYVWTNSWRRRGMLPRGEPDSRARSAVFRIPLDGAAPSALKTAGVPIDQMSFLEDSGGHLNVLLREEGGGEGMWGSEHTRGRMALLRVPLAEFGDGRRSAERQHYRVLPAVEGWSVQNRFVGDWLLWGGVGAGGHGPRGDANAWAMRYASEGEARPLAPGHQVERIEALGDDALLVGNVGADLHFSAVKLSRLGAELAGRHVQHGASQGETRTHGFFYRPTGRQEGIVGLPILDHQASRRQKGIYSGARGSASVMFLRQRDLAFSALGRLDANPEGTRDDRCKASCVDWYGNARPIFIGERVFALLGYELVEGRLVGGRFTSERIEERRRVNFAPGGATEGRYSPFS